MGNLPAETRRLVEGAALAVRQAEHLPVVGLKRFNVSGHAEIEKGAGIQGSHFEPQQRFWPPWCPADAGAAEVQWWWACPPVQFGSLSPPGRSALSVPGTVPVV